MTHPENEYVQALSEAGLVGIALCVLALIAFNRYHYSQGWPALDGQVYAFMVIAIAAAEVAVGLAIIVSLFKRRIRVDVDEINLLRG